jgi:hypothetical protein
MSASRCLLLETRFESEPGTWLSDLLPALRPLAEVASPTSLFTVSPGGRPSRIRKFKWSTLEELAGLPATGTISANDFGKGPDGNDRVSLSLYLRHNPGVEPGYHPPADVSMALIASDEEWGGALAGSVRFLEFAASVRSVLHGGITVLDNLAQANCELSGGLRSEADAQPTLFQRRRDHDWWRNSRQLWTHCRRLYWTTLLGPTLAASAGGADAARAAGALELREINGSLLFSSIEGPPCDSLDPAFLAATTRLRRWLWPHTFQNPLDAVGFEEEIGLAAPPLGP